MAVVREIDFDAFEEWLASRPPVIQELARRLPPDRLYRIKPDGHRVTLYSYSEDGTVTVVVTGEYNFVLFERKVFGISPDDLEECDPPAADEPTGDASTAEVSFTNMPIGKPRMNFLDYV